MFGTGQSVSNASSLKNGHGGGAASIASSMRSLVFTNSSQNSLSGYDGIPGSWDSVMSTTVYGHGIDEKFNIENIERVWNTMVACDEFAGAFIVTQTAAPFKITHVNDRWVDICNVNEKD
jgi:hypothetical protein